ncbi:MULTISPECIES: hypothetical protein [unclassified Campylobacter]|uniref:hypothetical protein n=1 Tax=unclassified Campylobacter TaxID=2593542 RepID=UPI001237F71E|nr:MULTISPECIES: hypothetical protein [unclassified Campylobacter]KAA6225387.1 hypothetical protein FMM54_06390 [Campylobacter sp. LR185c]KAA6227083.1 hypothetical protein FMM55_03785 [Campylobacter sp. LR196d]KAA6228709.1 hypothetical protein FMM57_02250 [Campylobacter sp. LR286c]KAA6229519.1 hypothetical protein FMM56_08205 [Campylobacter sp. LR264d]KAA6230763.1 hypothetical protein FMM58_04960 [Campylobacter sp. LR291e]
MERIVCLLIFLSVKLCCEEFIFWAELTNKNLILFHQKQNLSLAMTNSENADSEFACEIKFSQKDYDELPKNELGLIDDDMPKARKLSFLNEHKDELSECFIGAKISVKDIINTNLMQAKNETYVKILPLRFIVDFGQNSALIYYLKKSK